MAGLLGGLTGHCGVGFRWLFGLSTVIESTLLQPAIFSLLRQLFVVQGSAMSLPYHRTVCSISGRNTYTLARLMSFVLVKSVIEQRITLIPHSLTTAFMAFLASRSTVA